MTMTLSRYDDFLADPAVGVLASTLDDLEKVRIANDNRLRQLTRPRDQLDADGKRRGHGLTTDHPAVAAQAALNAQLEQIEHQAILSLGRAMRKHPLWAWAAPIKGVGEKQLARLLSVIGDPYWHVHHQAPRTLKQLQAYCGYHVVNGAAPKRQKGMQANWNEDARKRLWLISCSLVKQDSVYRDVYDKARVHYADAKHDQACVRCGPAGKPAQPGSELSLGHQHARGLRAVAKAFLADLWAESRRLHEEDEVS